MLRLILPALTAFALLTAGCATSRPPPVEPPSGDPPPLAQEPCRLPTLPDGKLTWAILERLYVERGEAILVCDQARSLAVQAHQDERAAVRAWLAEIFDDR